MIIGEIGSSTEKGLKSWGGPSYPQLPPLRKAVIKRPRISNTTTRDIIILIFELNLFKNLFLF